MHGEEKNIDVSMYFQLPKHALYKTFWKPSRLLRSFWEFLSIIPSDIYYNSFWNCKKVIIYDSFWSSYSMYKTFWSIV